MTFPATGERGKEKRVTQEKLGKSTRKTRRTRLSREKKGKTRILSSPAGEKKGAVRPEEKKEHSAAVSSLPLYFLRRGEGKDTRADRLLQERELYPHRRLREEGRQVKKGSQGGPSPLFTPEKKGGGWRLTLWSTEGGKEGAPTTIDSGRDGRWRERSGRPFGSRGKKGGKSRAGLRTRTWGKEQSAWAIESQVKGSKEMGAVGYFREREKTDPGRADTAERSTPSSRRKKRVAKERGE